MATSSSTRRLGSAAAWPAVARAQQAAVPVIGWLDSGFPNRLSEIAAVRRGLSEAGYIEGRNLVVEYRWGEERRERLPVLADDLVRREVAVIIAISTSSAAAAKAATKSIPIVFAIGVDPVETGLVASLNRPGGNLTGIVSLLVATAAKRVQVLHELAPTAATVGFLLDPSDVFAEAQAREMEAAARLLGVHPMIVTASDESELETVFATLVREKVGGLSVAVGGWFYSTPELLIALAARYRIPTMYGDRRYLLAGGLMSYGTDLPETRRLAGVYAGRILKGEKPGDLPVQQVTKMQLAINLKTANALGLTIPETLLATAERVIE
jgi:putative tryptophan/tyrosine transport system substrate-binding protein